jgi:hypothetical protein
VENTEIFLFLIDSGSAFQVIKNAAVEDMRKHIDVIYNHVREREAAKYVKFCWVPGKDNIVDVFTKALPRPAWRGLEIF